ncbi:MAG: hypothetical protein RLZZ383_2216 [Pseudomonadota bacterium]|jgi:hypothetical protein
MRPLLFLALWTACQDADAPSHTLTPHAPIAAVDGIERLDPQGAFLPGTVESFELRTQDPSAVVTWSASAGAIEAEGRFVQWTLPAEQVARLTATVSLADGTSVHQDLDIELAVLNPAAVGPVDASGEATGSFCDLVIDGNDVPHVLYRNDWHDQWRYAKFVGGVWTNELVDGPGFLGGGAAGYGQATMTIDAAGTVHVALVRDRGEIVYATRTNNVWTVATLVSDADPSSTAAIVFDGSNPHIIYTDTSGYLTLLRGVGTTWNFWKQVVNPSCCSAYAAGVAPAPNSQMRIAYINGYDLLYVNWSANNGFTNNRVIDYAIDDHTYADMYVSGTTVGVMGESGLAWSTNNGASFDIWESLGEGHNDFNKSFVFDGTNPKLAQYHSGTLEFVSVDARGYWSYSAVDTGISPYSSIQADLDAANNLHACYQKGGVIHFR